MKSHKPPSKPKKTYGHYLKYSGIAIQMAAYFGIAILIGSYLDQYFELPRPYLTVVLILIFGFGFFYKLINDLNKDRDL